MKALLTRWGDAALRAAGGDPPVVRALSAAFRRADDGYAELQRARNPRRGALPPGAAQTLLILLTTLMSVILSIVMVRSEGPLPLGPLLLAALHWFVSLNWLTGRAAPALLADADRDVLGWWPIRPRDLLLARILRLLRDAGIFALAVCGVPTLVLLVTGRPAGLAAVLFLTGMLLQSVALVFGIVTTAGGLLRLLGRDRATRLAALVADGNVGWILMILLMNSSFQMKWIAAHADTLAWLPPLWAGLWAAPTSPPTFLRGVLLLTVVTAVLVVAGTRLAGAAAPAASAPRRAGGGSRAWSAPLEAVLAPWLPGREGWVTRRLLAAHLRDDWRFVASTLFGPIMFLVMIFGAGHDNSLSVESTYSALMDIQFSFWVPFLAPMTFIALLGSSRPEALWPVALADLDAPRLLSAQRRVGRVLMLVPMLAAYAFRAVQLGVPWLWILGDAALLALLWENGVLLLQDRTRTMSFSRRINHDQDAKRVVVMMVSMVFNLANIGIIVAYASHPVAAVIGWVLALGIYGVLRYRLRSMRGRRLAMDLIPE